MDKLFQRKGSKSNADVGKVFELKVKDYFTNQGLDLQENIIINIGVNGTKPHKFDLGNLDKKIIIECKSHKWTEGSNVPSAKITTWDQAMYMFHSAPKQYRKLFIVLHDWSPKKNETLAEYYIRTNHHLIPKDVEIWEYDDIKNIAKKLKDREIT